MLQIPRKLLVGLEAAIGIEPMNKGFAVLKVLFSQVPLGANSRNPNVCLRPKAAAHFTHSANVPNH